MFFNTNFVHRQTLTLSLSTLSDHTRAEPPAPSSSTAAEPQGEGNSQAQPAGTTNNNTTTTTTSSSSSSPQQATSATDDPPLHTIQLPPEIIDYVDSARNPDIYTREFVELVQRGNQDLKGKAEAFSSFRDALAREMASAMPECKAEVERVVGATGGKMTGEL